MPSSRSCRPYTGRDGANKVCVNQTNAVYMTTERGMDEYQRGLKHRPSTFCTARCPQRFLTFLDQQLVTLSLCEFDRGVVELCRTTPVSTRLADTAE